MLKLQSYHRKILKIQFYDDRWNVYFYDWNASKYWLSNILQILYCLIDRSQLLNQKSSY